MKTTKGMQTVQPIRDPQKIIMLKQLLKEKNIKYYFMLTLGLNSGLRVSDMLKLRVSDIKDKTHVTITEQKTGKPKRFLINDMLKEEVNFYITDSVLSEDDYIIPSRKGDNRPISRVQAYRILNEAAKRIGLEEVGTHTMRKTFGYHHYREHKDVAVLQSIFNHSAPSVTLRYIGVNQDMQDSTLQNFFI